MGGGSGIKEHKPIKVITCHFHSGKVLKISVVPVKG